MVTGTRRPARRRRLSTWWGALGCAAALAGCNGADGTPVEPDAEAYAVVVEHFLPATAEPDELPVVYVVPLGDASLSLDDQVSVIDRLAEVADVRFADDVAAVLDPGTDGTPPRDHGLLVGVGTIAVDRPHVVRVEIYRDDRSVDAHLVTLAFGSGAWSVTTDELVEPEVLDAG